MNRAELISEIAEITGQPKITVNSCLSAILHSITGGLSRGERITLVGFGTFERRTRQGRTGRNPRTLAPLRIPASRVPAFRAGQELKDVVDGRARQKAWSAPGAKPSVKRASKKAGKSRHR